jgi:hypothetical protein
MSGIEGLGMDKDAFGMPVVNPPHRSQAIPNAVTVGELLQALAGLDCTQEVWRMVSVSEAVPVCLADLRVVKGLKG